MLSWVSKKPKGGGYSTELEVLKSVTFEGIQATELACWEATSQSQKAEPWSVGLAGA